MAIVSVSEADRLKKTPSPTPLPFPSELSVSRSDAFSVQYSICSGSSTIALPSPAALPLANTAGLDGLRSAALLDDRSKHEAGDGAFSRADRIAGSSGAEVRRVDKVGEESRRRNLVGGMSDDRESRERAGRGIVGVRGSSGDEGGDMMSISHVLNVSPEART